MRCRGEGGRAPQTGRAHVLSGSVSPFTFVGGSPPPGAGPEATRNNTFAVDFRDLVSVTREKRLGRAHLGADRKLALGDPVTPVLLELGC